MHTVELIGIAPLELTIDFIYALYYKQDHRQSTDLSLLCRCGCFPYTCSMFYGPCEVLGAIFSGAWTSNAFA